MSKTNLKYFVSGGQYGNGIKVTKVQRVTAIAGKSGQISMAQVYTDGGMLPITVDIGQVIGPKLADTESVNLVLNAISESIQRQAKLAAVSV